MSCHSKRLVHLISAIMIFLQRNENEKAWKQLLKVQFDTTNTKHNLRLLPKEAILLPLSATDSLVFIYLRYADDVASGWGDSQSHICWKDFLFSRLVFHQMRELSYLILQLQGLLDLVSEEKKKQQTNEGKKKVAFQLDQSTLCMAPCTQLHKCQSNIREKEELQQSQLRMA